MLVIALLIYAWNSISEYQATQDSLANIEDTAKFNQQFTNYDRDDVQGYELLSLINKVIDYNERETQDTVNGGDSAYPTIAMIIYLEEDTSSTSYREKLTYDGIIRLFSDAVYGADELVNVNTTTKKRATFKETITNKEKSALDGLTINGETLTETEATNIAKKISSIFMTNTQIENKAGSSTNDTLDTVKLEMINAYNSCVSSGKQITISDIDKLILPESTSSRTNQVYIAACTYYEYMQFKRGIFKCTTIEYDTANTGRVIKIEFTFTGKIY